MPQIFQSHDDAARLAVDALIIHFGHPLDFYDRAAIAKEIISPLPDGTYAAEISPQSAEVFARHRRVMVTVENETGKVITYDDDLTAGEFARVFREEGFFGAYGALTAAGISVQPVHSGNLEVEHHWIVGAKLSSKCQDALVQYIVTRWPSVLV